MLLTTVSGDHLKAILQPPEWQSQNYASFMSDNMLATSQFEAVHPLALVHMAPVFLALPPLPAMGASLSTLAAAAVAKSEPLISATSLVDYLAQVAATAATRCVVVPLSVSLQSTLASRHLNAIGAGAGTSSSSIGLEDAGAGADGVVHADDGNDSGDNGSDSYSRHGSSANFESGSADAMTDEEMLTGLVTPSVAHTAAPATIFALELTFDAGPQFKELRCATVPVLRASAQAARRVELRVTPRDPAPAAVAVMAEYSDGRGRAFAGPVAPLSLKFHHLMAPVPLAAAADGGLTPGLLFTELWYSLSALHTARQQHNSTGQQESYIKQAAELNAATMHRGGDDTDDDGDDTTEGIDSGSGLVKKGEARLPASDAKAADVMEAVFRVPAGVRARLCTFFVAVPGMLGAEASESGLVFLPPAHHVLFSLTPCATDAAMATVRVLTDNFRVLPFFEAYLRSFATSS
jgi:hypothetical protein